jgi:hypothetical protein
MFIPWPPPKPPPNPCAKLMVETIRAAIANKIFFIVVLLVNTSFFNNKDFRVIRLMPSPSVKSYLRYSENPKV